MKNIISIDDKKVGGGLQLDNLHSFNMQETQGINSLVFLCV